MRVYAFLLSALMFLSAQPPSYFIDLQAVGQNGQPVVYLRTMSPYREVDQAWRSSMAHIYAASVAKFDTRLNKMDKNYYESYYYSFFDGGYGDYFGLIRFWGQDTSQWLRIGEDLSTDNWFYLKHFKDESDWSRPASAPYPVPRLSPNDPSRVYLDFFISTDSGRTFPYESALPVLTILGEAPGAPQTLYAVDYDNTLLISGDGGQTFSVADSDHSWSGETELRFDPDGIYVYALIEDPDFAGNFKFLRSDDMGRPGSWQELTPWEPITGARPVIRPGTTSGKLYAIYDHTIWSSDQYGDQFNVLYEHNRRLTGMDNIGDTLYLTDAFALHQFLPDGRFSTLYGQELSPLLAFDPMHIGDQWTYRHINGNDSSLVRVTISGDTLIHNTRYLVRLENNTPRYLRQDSITARLFEYIPDSLREYVVLDWAIMPEDRQTGFSDQHETAWHFKKEFMEDDLNGRSILHRAYQNTTDGYEVTYAAGLGLVTREPSDNGVLSERLELKGAYINGQLYGDTSLVVTALRDKAETPAAFRLYANYPNPFNPSTLIRFNLPRAQHVTLQVFDINGRLIATLFDGWMQAGNHALRFNASHLAGGVYFYRLSAENGQTQSRKMILLK